MTRHPFVRDGADGGIELVVPVEQGDVIVPLPELAILGIIGGLAMFLKRRVQAQLREPPPPPD